MSLKMWHGIKHDKNVYRSAERERRATYQIISRIDYKTVLITHVVLLDVYVCMYVGGRGFDVYIY